MKYFHQNYMISFWGDLKERYETFTPSQRRIADYLFDDPSGVLILNATQIANEANVSEATLTRFITVFGFSGFSEFKRKISQQILQEHSVTKRLIKSTETLGNGNSVLNKIIEADIENISGLPANISDALFKTAVSKIASGKTIYVVGLRTSFTCAFYLAFSLRFFMKSVRLVTPNVADLPDQFLHAASKDVLVAISFRRYTHATVRIAELAKKKGVCVIAITNSLLSPLAKLADLVLITETDIPTFTQSYTAPISLITALITALSLKNKKHVMAALEELERNHELFETFYK
jgi:DNA-binding MurR/RpiR family transcriptional regulator